MGSTDNGKSAVQACSRRHSFCCIEKDIATDEVIITDERIAHINEEHPGDYEVIAPLISEALICPDCIIKDDHHEGTCINNKASVKIFSDLPGRKRTPLCDKVSGAPKYLSKGGVLYD